ncbi:MAG: response regulator transcription factor [Ignavibacteria bacterium]|nr:response regulator transcription factor [Ignavibacteria bacterium]
MTDKIKIIIADDHPIFSDGLKQFIDKNENMCVTGVAANGKEALDMILNIKPDIAVLDISMPVKTGLEVLRELRDIKSKTKIIFLTLFREEDIFNEAMNLGVEGYVLKESAANDIIECINQVANNNYYISPLISNLLINRRNKTSEHDTQKPMLSTLSPTERRILKLVAQNKTSKEISDELFISYRTVENHRTTISNKLNLHGTHSLVKFAIENKSIL